MPPVKRKRRLVRRFSPSPPSRSRARPNAGTSTSVAGTSGGGSESEGVQRVSIKGDPLWSSRLLLTAPDLLKDMHKRFLENGADIIQTISYQATIPLLCKYADLSVEDAKATIKKSVTIAREAIDEFWTDYQKKIGDGDSTLLKDRRKPMVCACIGPYGVQYFAAEEYKGNYIDKVTEKDIISLQRPRIETLVDAGVDYFAVETIPVQREAEVMSKLMREFPNTKTWVSFQCKDGEHLGHGEKLSDAVESIAKDGFIKYVGVNCCQPTVVTPLLESIQKQRRDYSLQLVTYPNNGQIWIKNSFEETGRMTGPSLMSAFAPALPKWIELGASIIGGCCQTSPKDIKLIRDYLNEKAK